MTQIKRTDNLIESESCCFRCLTHHFSFIKMLQSRTHQLQMIFILHTSNFFVLFLHVLFLPILVFTERMSHIFHQFELIMAQNAYRASRSKFRLIGSTHDTEIMVLFTHLPQQFSSSCCDRTQNIVDNKPTYLILTGKQEIMLCFLFCNICFKFTFFIGIHRTYNGSLQSILTIFFLHHSSPYSKKKKTWKLFLHIF